MGLGQSRDRDAPTRLAQGRSSFLCLQRQVRKLASGSLKSWSLLCNNNMAINLEIFTSCYGSSRFSACDQGSHWGFFHSDLFFKSICVSRFNYEKSREICVFWSDKLINNYNVLNNMKLTLHYNVCMRTSGEKVHISDEVERVQSASYSHIRSFVRVIYSGVFKRRQARQLPLAPFATVMHKVPCFQRGPK